MLFNIIKQVIASGITEGLEEKIDGFYAKGKLTKKEYDELLALLKENGG